MLVQYYCRQYLKVCMMKKSVNLRETSIHKITVFIQLSCFLLCWSHAGNERGGNQRDMEEENERSLFWLSVTVRLDSGVSNTKRLTYLHLLLTLMAFCTANFSHLRSLWRLCHTKLIKVIWRTKLENTELYREEDRLKDTRVHKQTNTHTHRNHAAGHMTGHAFPDTNESHAYWLTDKHT